MKSYLFTIIIYLFHFALVGQGVIITNHITLADTTDIKIDPARYHKIQFIDFKIGTLYSDDRGFQRFLKNYGYQPGVRNFYNFGGSYNFLIKKLNLGLKADIAWQKGQQLGALWHSSWQAAIGYALFRKNNKVLTLNSNFGIQRSTIMFGNLGAPDFLSILDFSNSQCKLFQKEFIVGSSLNFNKMLNKRQIDRGLNLGLELGVNFAPFNPVWRYGYKDEEGLFIGQEITDMPQVAKQTIFSTVKIGFWSAQ